MPRTIVRNLWRGESDQPIQVRREGQSELGRNLRMDVTRGGPATRASTDFIADLGGPAPVIEEVYTKKALATTGTSVVNVTVGAGESLCVFVAAFATVAGDVTCSWKNQSRYAMKMLQHQEDLEHGSHSLFFLANPTEETDSVVVDFDETQDVIMMTVLRMSNARTYDASAAAFEPLDVLPRVSFNTSKDSLVIAGFYTDNSLTPDVEDYDYGASSTTLTTKLSGETEGTHEHSVGTLDGEDFAASLKTALLVTAANADHTISAIAFSPRPGSLAEYFELQIRDALILIAEDEVLAFRVTDGSLLTINDQSETGDAFGGYFRHGSGGTFVPKNDLVSAVSVDTAIVANRTVTCESDDGWNYQQTMNFIANGDVNLSGPTVTDLTDPGVVKFSDLPASPANGDVYRVLQDENQDPHGVYVFYVFPPNAKAVGFYSEHDNWFRIPTENLADARWINNTMPIRIVYNAELSAVVVAEGPWKQRVSGGEGTNVIAPLKDQTVRTLEFMASRLMLIPDSHVVGSRGNDFYMLWLDNVNVVTDEDRIVLDLATFKDMGRPLRSVVLGHSMLLCMENGQMSFGARGEALTATNGSFKIITTFTSLDIEPGDAGEVCYIADTRGYIHQYGVFESAGLSTIGYVSWLNVHRVRAFRAAAPTQLFGYDRSLFVTTDGGNLIAHDGFSSGGEVIQSAWSQMAFYAVVEYVARWEERLYLLQLDDEGYSLVSYEHQDPLVPAGMTFPPRLDRRELLSGSYDSDEDETTFTHTGRDGDAATSTLVCTSVGNVHFVPTLKRVEPNGDVVFSGGSGLDGDWRAIDAHFLGFVYGWELELSRFWPNDDETKLTTSKITVQHFEASDYELVVVRHDREDEVHPWSAQQLPLETADPLIATGFKRFETAIDARNAVVKLRSNSSGQATLIRVAYQYEVQESD